MLSEKKAMGYAHINFPMDLSLKKNLNIYLIKNFNVTVFEFAGNLFDIKSLNRPVNLDCMNCHLAHTQLCCDGSPYPPSQKDIDKIMNKYDIILSETQSKSDYTASIKHIEENGLINNDRSFTEHCGKCIFSIKVDNKGTHACAIHGYALNNNIDYTLLKPKGCMMYPIDIVHLTDGSDFIFGADIDTTIDIVYLTDGNVTMDTENKGFSRWNDLDLDFICLNKGHRRLIMETRAPQSSFSKGTLPDTVFKLEDYKPAYEQEESMLIRLYGKNSYDFIKSKSAELKKKGLLTMDSYGLA